MFILFNSLCPKNDISFEDQEVEKGPSISPLSKLAEKIWKQFPLRRLILVREYAFGSDRDESKTRRSDP